MNPPHIAPHFESWRFSVAPMMDWTDKHCRYFHRLLTTRALLYTEMVTCQAIMYGNDPQRFLAYNAEEHPVALQLGGSDPALLAQAIAIANPFGYDEINLNVGCPSDRVKSGSFGACLMATPHVVAECVRAMKAATDVPITVKCRIGIDDQDVEATLPRFLESIINAGVDGVIIHARRAILGGLSPHQNRTVPPLNYELVNAMKRQFPQVPMAINGGIMDLEMVQTQLNSLNGAMVGRAAYQNPWLLAQVDSTIFGQADPIVTEQDLLAPMCAYAEAQLQNGATLHHIAKHMLGLFTGQPGARTFRRILTEESLAKGAGPEVFERAWAAITA